MNQTAFHADIRKLFPDVVDEDRLTAAEKAAFLTMAHYIDLPDAEDKGSQAVTSATPNYTISTDSGKDIDRITSVVWVGSNNYNLIDLNIREYQFLYRGTATTGEPDSYCYYNGQIWLYPIPDESGTIYFSCQIVVTSLTSFPDNYYPLMLALIKKNLLKEGSGEWYWAYREARDLIKSFKTRMHPKKRGMEMGTYRSARIQDLNNLI